MEIKSITIHRVAVPLKKQMKISHISMTRAEAIIVLIATDSGALGIGESTPLTGYTKSTPGTTYSILKEQMAPALIGSDPRDAESCLMRMQRTVVPETNTESLTALETGLMDLSAKELGVPVSRLLGGHVMGALPVVGWIGLAAPKDMMEDARRVMDDGFKVLKIKLAGQDADIERVKAVKEVAGSTPVRVDANESYIREGLLRKLDKLDLELIEQPGPRHDIQYFKKVSNVIDTPIMLDESAATMADILHIAQSGAAGIVKLKLMRQGGFLMTKKCANVLEAAGIPCVVGHGFNLLTGALSEFQVAASLSNLWGACEVGGPYDKMADDVVDGELKLKDGSISSANAPGIGVSVNEVKLEKYTVEKCTVA